MAVLIGIDLGTQSVKALLADTDTGARISCGREYPVRTPRPGYAEQMPQTWWDALSGVLQELRDRTPAMFDSAAGIGLTGQMHGLVALRENLEPAYPAIVWLDQRSSQQVKKICESMPEAQLASHMQNRVFTGFAFPSLLWLKENEPEVYAHIRHVISPKDYIRLRLTGELGCEHTDASATSMYDMVAGGWFDQLLHSFDVDPELLPACRGSMEAAGRVTKAAAEQTGLREGIPVIYGCGDESALLLGNGVCHEGPVIINIGTGATVSVCSSTDKYDPLLRTQTFCHAQPETYAVFGAILGGGINMRWLRDDVLGYERYGEMSQAAATVPPGSNGLLFLPYLAGDRTPHMDPEATGMYFGLRLSHDRACLIRAIMEGVGFAILDSVRILEQLGACVDAVTISGGGAKSDVWMQSLADILQKEIRMTDFSEQASLGAVILAGASLGEFANLSEACDAMIQWKDKRFCPDPDNAQLYNDSYAMYRELYEANADLMHKSARMMRGAGCEPGI